MPPNRRYDAGWTAAGDEAGGGERSFQSAVWLVGPEGGPTDAERHAASAAGFESVGLGGRTPGFETATVAGLAILAAVLDARAGPDVDGRAGEGGDESRGATETGPGGPESVGASEAGPDRSRSGAT